MEDGGYAIIAASFIILLAFMLGAGAGVVVEQSNLVSSAKRAQSRISSRVHESLDITIRRNSENTEIVIQNTGSTPSVIEKILVKKEGGSIEVNATRSTVVDILDEEVVSLNKNVSEDSTIGVLTHLGNTFWEV